MIADIMIADIMMLRIEGCTSSMISHDDPGKVHIKYDHEDFTYGCLVEGRGVATFIIHYIVSKNNTSHHRAIEICPISNRSVRFH